MIIPHEYIPQGWGRKGLSSWCEVKSEGNPSQVVTSAFIPLHTGISLRTVVALSSQIGSEERKGTVA